MVHAGDAKAKSDSQRRVRTLRRLLPSARLRNHRAKAARARVGCGPRSVMFCLLHRGNHSELSYHRPGYRPRQPQRENVARNGFVLQSRYR